MDEMDKQNNELENEANLLANEGEYPEDNLADTDYNMETASEVAAPGIGNRSNLAEPEREEEEQDATMEANVNDESMGKGLGITALILSICSLFFLPVITGGAGIVLGIFAARKGANALGYWSIGLGAFSIAMTVIFAPFF
ncbi:MULTISPECIES: DUF4190 domain-containing protein [Alteribacillus]|uniref:DUF4190 domain-containing protein n=1 Tax=Alteribacillus bidgolensis TaxID=930129 RepID=A0A1G8P2G0_9BACI|nr:MULTISPECIES: DUF4190 domain-containing protein [Alteribacillus]SDI86684.1 hypothetical protein SAMN05216352_11389 [Alteribacillus bidgolensis]